MADIRERNKFAIRRSDLDGWRDYYKKDLKRFAEPSEAEQLETLFARAETLIERDDSAFDDALNDIRDLGFTLHFRDDEYTAYRFNQPAKYPDDVTDREGFYRLVQTGNAALNFDENPFRVLNVSIHDTKATIIERADDLSFADLDNEKFFAQAQDILINTRKRIAAEVRRLVGENIDIENLSEDILRIDKKFSALNAEDLRDRINSASAI